MAMRSSLGERRVPYPSLSEGWSLAITPRVAIAVSLLFTISAPTASRPQRQGLRSGGVLASDLEAGCWDTPAVWPCLDQAFLHPQSEASAESFRPILFASPSIAKVID